MPEWNPPVHRTGIDGGKLRPREAQGGAWGHVEGSKKPGPGFRACSAPLCPVPLPFP